MEFGLGTTDQRVPSHRSTNVACTELFTYQYPTAKHIVLVGHAMPESRLATARAGLGLATTVQRVPSHRSISDLWPVLADVDPPTAKQRLVVVHATSLSDATAVAEAPGTGAAAADHRPPAERVTTGRLCSK